MSEAARCIENAFDTGVIVVSAGRVLGCALRHHGIHHNLHSDEAPDATLIADCEQNDTVCTADVQNNSARVVRRVAVADQGVPSFPFFSRQRFR